MSTVRRLGNGMWHVDISTGVGFDGSYRRIRRQFRTKAEAEAFELAERVKAGMGIAGGKMLLGDFIEQVFWEEKPWIRANTRRGYERDIDLRIMPALGSMPVDRIDRMAIQRMLSACPTRKVATNARETLSSILSLAVELSLIPSNPASCRFSYPSPGGGASGGSGAVLATFAEHRAFLERVEELHAGDATERICVLGLCFGLRVGEVFGMDWESVDLRRGTVRVSQTYTCGKGGAHLTDPKTPKAFREIPMSAWARRRIADWGGGEGPVIMSGYGNRMHPSTGRERVARMISASGRSGSPLPAVTIFSMRHSFATACINAGMPVSKVSRLLGHCDVTTTINRYVRHDVEDLRSEFGAVDAAMGEQPGDR